MATVIRLVNEVGKFVGRPVESLEAGRRKLATKEWTGFVATFTRTPSAIYVELFLDKDSSVTTVMGIRASAEVTVSSVPLEAESPAYVERFAKLLHAALGLARELREDLTSGRGPTHIVKGLPEEEGKEG